MLLTNGSRATDVAAFDFVDRLLIVVLEFLRPLPEASGATGKRAQNMIRKETSFFILLLVCLDAFFEEFGEFVDVFVVGERT